jgi:para-nitrobenzyl esterase
MRRSNSLRDVSTSEGPPAGDAFMACPICFEVFTTGGSSAPRVLDCSHSFCVGCINRWVEVAPEATGQIQGDVALDLVGPRVTCPLCRQMTASLRPQASPTGSTDSLEGLQDGMRMVWLGPEGIAWVDDGYGGSQRVRRLLKMVVLGGILIIAVLAAAIAVLATHNTPQDNHHHHNDTFPTLVQTSLGQIQGKVEPFSPSVHDQSLVRVFRGVRYAEPPQRFRPARSKQPWDGVAKATANAHACMQAPAPEGLNVSEDCLYLNMWSPVKPYSKFHRFGPVMPVLVWIHGGAFHWGSASGGPEGPVDGAQLALRTGAIVIAVQYRLGPLGFFQSEEIVRENQQFPAHGGANGIYDMVMALRWISDNILSFNGDPNRVTVFGSGLGGGLGVCSLTVSPWSAGLFKRAVISSGPCNGPWEPWELRQSLSNSHRLQRDLNATNLSEMRTLPASSLLCHVEDYGKRNAPMACSVDYSVDGWVIPSPPSELYSKGGTIEFDVMLGATTEDTLAAPPWNLGVLPSSQKDLKGLLTNITKNATTTEQILTQYQPFSSASAKWLQISSDVCSVCPTKWLADDMALSSHDGGPTPYLYQYSGPDPSALASHGAEVSEIFGIKAAHGRFPFSPELSIMIQEYWGSFAKDGAPASPSAAANGAPMWPIYHVASRPAAPNDTVLMLAPFVTTADAAAKFSRCSFWEKTTEAMLRRRICYETNPIPHAQLRLAQLRLEEEEALAKAAKRKSPNRRLGSLVAGSASVQEL